MKTVIVTTIFGLWALAAPIQQGERMKSSNEMNATNPSVHNKTGFKPTANPQPAEMKFNTPYYPRGTIATH